MSSPPIALPAQPIRLVLVEDHDMVAEAMDLALSQASGMRVVARSGSITAAMAEVGRSRPDVVVLDRRLPDGDGVSAIGGLMEVAPGARVLVLTGEASVAVATRVAQAGGAGLMLKSAGLQELVTAVRRVAAGEVVFGSDVLPGVLDRLTGRVRGSATTLTARERETLVLLAEGAGAAQIGHRLGIAHNTARNHVQRVLEKLGARSKLEAVAIARRDGLLD